MPSAKPPVPLRPGRYRHYKGLDYQVFGLVRHSETEEWLVHYRTLYGDFSHWVRPYRMFVEQVEVDGEPVPRFDFIGPADEPAGRATAKAVEDAIDKTAPSAGDKGEAASRSQEAPRP